MTGPTSAAASVAHAAGVDNVRGLVTDRRINSSSVKDRDLHGLPQPAKSRARTGSAYIPLRVVRGTGANSYAEPMWTEKAA